MLQIKQGLLVHVARVDKRGRHACLAATASTTDPMDVILHGQRQFICYLLVVQRLPQETVRAI